MNPTSLFSNLMRAFDEASRADQLRLLEQSARLAQQRSLQAAEQASAQPLVVHKDGFAPAQQVPVALGQNAGQVVRVTSRLDSDRAALERRQLSANAAVALASRG